MVGTIALSDALAAGALSGLEQLSLAGNTIRDAGVGALAGAIAAGAIPSLVVLSLHNTDTGNAGVEALATALLPAPIESSESSGPRTRLQHLKELVLSDNEVG